MRKRNGTDSLFAFKKANTILDVVTGLAFIVIIMISVIFGKYILDEVTTEAVADPDLHNETKAILTDWNDRYVSFWDNLFIFVLVMIWILLIVSVMFIDSHPVFFIIILVGAVTIFIVGLYLSNAYMGIMDDDSIRATAEQFTVTHWVLGHLLHVCLLYTLTLPTTPYV